MPEIIKNLFFKFQRFITYGLVGCFNTLLDFAVFMLFSSVLGVSPELSQAAGYVAGFTSSFILNRTFTFKDRSGKNRKQFLSFLCVNLVSLATSYLLMYLLTSLSLHKNLAKLLVTGIVMVINYFGYKLFVFKDENERKGAEDNE